ncbi:Transcription factor GLABRA 3 [Striga hermonthica]|uniref:Transcription factor GLABRA 3 n=1 Tax=Striga hermonthica TaxID=68872 RepID=A0A9N7MQZ8_STRHE|nr:Transcription factor GLABRA 3 [Striga hermonthica]
MSFVFNFDQGLPGRTLANNQAIWLCNAHVADTKIFSRSLLAKTIACFPHLGGVIELGATELVPEDMNLIQHIKTMFLDCPSTVVPDNPFYFPNGTNNDLTNIPEDGLDHLLDCPDIDITSPNNSSNEFADNLLRDESNLVEGEASQIQSWPFMDDAISNCLNNSVNSSECVSQTHEDPESVVPFLGGNNEMDGLIQELQPNNDGHYHSVLSNLLKSSHQLILGPYFKNGGRKSSFVGWKKDELIMARPAETGKSQKLLKKVLFEVAKMHENYRLESVRNKNADSRPEVEENEKNHVLSERKRREKINERFMILGSIVPSGGKVDKVSILDHTIQYLSELERKVEELESYKASMELDSTAQTKPQDAAERTSGNYSPNKVTNSNKKSSAVKRKASEIERTQAHDDITINVIDKDVLIEMRCPWKDCVLVEIMAAVNKLRMDTQNVQSSNTDGILSLTIKAKCKGLRATSASVIREALQKIIKKC